MFSRSITAFVGLCLMAAAPGHAQSDTERAAAPVSIMFPGLGEYLALDEGARSHFTIEYVLTSLSDADKDFDIWIDTETGKASIDRASDGVVDIDTVAPFVESNPMVMISLPEGDGALNLMLVPALELTREIAIEDICLALEQAKDAAANSGGMIAEMAPSLKGIGFELSPETDVRLRKDDLSEEVIVESHSRAWIEPTDEICDAGGAMLFSKPALDTEYSQ